jgi:hypothetical protein
MINLLKDPVQFWTEEEFNKEQAEFTQDLLSTIWDTISSYEADQNGLEFKKRDLREVFIDNDTFDCFINDLSDCNIYSFNNDAAAAMDYLKQHDPTLEKSLKLAEESYSGYKLADLDIFIFADLLVKERTKQELINLLYLWEDDFNKSKLDFNDLSEDEEFSF